ncbi:MAG: hypothetical protein P8X69_04815, partial [Maritimibacter sp.]
MNYGWEAEAGQSLDHPIGHFVGFSLPVFCANFRSNPLLIARLLSAVAIGLSRLVAGLFVVFRWAQAERGCYPIKAL